MDTEQTFVRVHARLSGMLAQLMTPKLRILLEHLSLLVAIVLLGLIAVMHVNFVAQPGCAKELISKELVEAQLLQIKITGYGLRLPQALSQKHDGHVESMESLQTEPQINEEISEVGDMETTVLDKEKSPMRNSDLARNMWTELGSRPLATGPIKLCERFMTYGTAFFGRLKWIFSSTWQISRIAGKELLTVRSKSSPKGLYGALVSWLEQRSEAFTPLYIFSVEKGYLMLPEDAKSRHFIHTANISISAQNVCFGNRWQQLVINIFVGYDTILMNSLLNARGEGFLFNFQTKELYDLNYLNESSGSPNTFEGYIVAKSGVLIMSLFVFFTTTTSVSFTLRETQARMLKFTVQLQYHARHGLPTFRLIFIHIIESLVFVPIMIGILFFLFEFYDDQLLAFMVLTLVWLCELFTMISVRTPMSMQYYPRFFLLYFMLFHIYFFSYEYGFSYLAFSTTAAFMQHLILYFWNHFEIPLLRQFLRARALFQQQPGLHITSAVITSTVHVARFRPGSGGGGSPEASGNLYNLNMANRDLQSAGIHGDMQFNATNEPSNQEPTNNQGIPNMQFEPPPPFPPLLPNLLTSFSSLLLWILGGPENPLSNSSNLRNPWEQQFNRGDNNPVVWNATQNFPQGMWYTAAGALERLRRRNSGRNPPPEGQNTT